MQRVFHFRLDGTIFLYMSPKPALQKNEYIPSFSVFQGLSYIYSLLYSM